MNYEIKPADEKGFTLFYRGIEIGTAKLHCDAVLVAKRLDKEFELEFHRGAKTPELMLETQKIKTEIQNKILEVRADIARRKMKEQEKEQEKENRCRMLEGQRQELEIRTQMMQVRADIARRENKA